jgi:hypothetical protein
MGRAYGRNGEKDNAYRLFVGEPEGKQSLGRARLRWVDNIEMDLGKRAWDGIDWTGLDQDMYQWRAFVNTATLGFHSIGGV